MNTNDRQRLDFELGVKAGAVLGVTVTSIFAGYAIAAMQKDFGAAPTFLFTLFVCASPAQYAVIDMIGSGAAVWQFILVGVLVNVRFFMMSLTASHFARHLPLRQVIPWASFMAASPFLLSLFHKRRHHNADFFAFYRGVVAVAVPMTWFGTLAGMYAADALPPLGAYAAILFLPVYFTILVANDVKKRLEIFTVGAAFLLTPYVEMAAPGWGIILASFVSATLALGIRVWTRQAR